MSNSTVTVTINNVFIMNQTIQNPLTVIYGNTNFNWTSNGTATLCFSPKYYITNPLFYFFGPTINNITLTKISSNTSNTPNNTNTSNNSNPLNSTNITNISINNSNIPNTTNLTNTTNFNNTNNINITNIT